MYKKWLLLAALLGATACGGSDGGDDTSPETGTGGDTDDAGVPGTGGEAAETGGDDGELAECEKEANVAEIAALTAAQPVISTRAKDTLSEITEFDSLADDPSTSCSAELTFKDLNGNGELDPYEDWRLTPKERAADLLTRMETSDKLALMAHPITADSSATVESTTADLIAQGVRFGVTTALSTSYDARATWANAVQELAEDTALGIPFVVSSEPSHASGNGRERAAGFPEFPFELSLAASGDVEQTGAYGAAVASAYAGVGVRMALSPNANLATEPRWYGTQFTFGDDASQVSSHVSAYVGGLQDGSTVAAAIGQFPGAGAAKNGIDARLAKGQYLAYADAYLDDHLAPFAAAMEAGVDAITLSAGIPEAGAWTGLAGAFDGSTVEQVGAAFNADLITTILRGHYGYDGLVMAPAGVLDDDGMPWGVADLSRPERIAKAASAGVDQFLGLDSLQDLSDAGLSDAQIDTAAGRALALMFKVGAFENPYVAESYTDVTQAVSTPDISDLANDAMSGGVVVLVNDDKPSNFLNGDGDGSQTGDKGNAGNGTGKVLPAPPGEPYVSVGCSFYVTGNFSMDYIRTVSAGYGALTNDISTIDGATVENENQKITYSDYVFVRLDAPYTADPDSGDLALSTQALTYANNDNAALLTQIADIRAAIDADPDSSTQLIVGIDAGRAPILNEVLAIGVDGLLVSWGVSDKGFLDAVFGIVPVANTLPVGLPASEEAAASQISAAPSDGLDSTFIKGFGLSISAF